MRQYTYPVVILIICVFLSCKKKTTPVVPIVTPPDTTAQPTQVVDSLPFEFIPVDSVKWIIHGQGSMSPDSIHGGYFFDTSVHIYTTVTAIGDTNFYNQIYYRYHLDINNVYKSHAFTTYGTLYVKFDTINKKVSAWQHLGNMYEPETVIIDFNANVGDNTANFYGTPQQTIGATDSILIEGHKYKSWYTYGGQFYLAYGIGWQMGILPQDVWYIGNGGQVVSMDYIYKGDSLHFDYPFYYHQY